jgi:peptidoglycan/LPS O-acetylase OafA/YrhL
LTKLKNLQSLRGIAVLLVVIYHLTYIEQKYGGSETILPEFFKFTMFGVDLFFVISGFVMVMVTRGKFQNIHQSFRFIYHRVARIYPLYWVYTILMLIVFLIQPTWINNAQGNQMNIVDSFLLIPSHILPLVTVGWTLIHEIYFYLVFFIILLICPERFLTQVLILWTATICLVNLFFNSSNATIMLVSNPLTLEFIGGNMIAILYFKKDFKINISILIFITLVSLLLSLLAFVYSSEHPDKIISLDWWRLGMFAIPALLVIYCSVVMEKKAYILHAYLNKIGDASYSIYLSHIITLSAFGHIWGLFSIDSIWDNIIILPILFFMVIIFGFISYQLIEKPLLQLTRKIYS